jgi:hypothetical protein
MGSYRSGYPTEVPGGESPRRGIKRGKRVTYGKRDDPNICASRWSSKAKWVLRLASYQHGARDITPSHIALCRQAPYRARWGGNYLELLPHPAGEEDGRRSCCRSGERMSETTYALSASEGIPLMGERFRSPGSYRACGERRCQQRSAR